MSTCGCRMEPAGRFQHPNEEYVIIQRCLLPIMGITFLTSFM